MDKNKSTISTLCVLLAGVLWGMLGLFVRGLGEDGLTSLAIVFFRSSVSALLLFVYIMIFNKEALRIRIKDIWCFVGTGIISLTTFNICYFTTIQRTSMAVAAILLYTSPVFVMILSAILFKEAITWIKVIALIVAVGGCALVTGVLSGAGLVMDGLGILIGIGAGVGYALYSIFGRYAIEKGYESTTISFYTFLFASLGMFVASPVLAPIQVTVTTIVNGNTLIDVLLIVGIAIVSTILPYLLYTKGLEGMENGRAGIMASIEPVVAAILGIVIYHESMSASTFAGIILVFVAIVLLNINVNSGKLHKDR